MGLVGPRYIQVYFLFSPLPNSFLLLPMLNPLIIFLGLLGILAASPGVGRRYRSSTVNVFVLHWLDQPLFFFESARSATIDYLYVSLDIPSA
jgi:hypothetical protein